MNKVRGEVCVCVCGVIGKRNSIIIGIDLLGVSIKENR